MNDYDIDYEELAKDCWGIYGMSPMEVFVDVLHFSFELSEYEIEALIKGMED